MTGSLRIVPLSAAHDRSNFVSNSEPLDRYFREHASQDVKRRIATCFVAVDADTDEIAGFYTLAATSIVLEALSPEIVKKLPRYPVLPATLLGRLAVARAVQGQGVGSILLSDALIRTSQAGIGVFVMLVDAKDETAQRFYERYGFRLLAGETRRLGLPIATALRLMEGRGH